MMNIRSLSNPQVPTKVDTTASKVRDVESSVKPHDTSDRDADGREFQKNKKKPVTEEELKNIMKAIKEHPGVSSNNLLVSLTEENGVRVLYVKTQDGKTIRRVTEDNFYELLSFIDQSNPRLLNKSA